MKALGRGEENKYGRSEGEMALPWNLSYIKNGSELQQFKRDGEKGKWRHIREGWEEDEAGRCTKCGVLSPLPGCVPATVPPRAKECTVFTPSHSKARLWC